MRRIIAFAIIAVGFGGFAASMFVADVSAQSRHAAVIELDKVIEPSSAGYVDRAITKAATDGAELVIIRLDTPGGLFDSTRDMVNSILESEIPVVVYVGPSAARAASAGTFILAAGHIAAMVPGTNVGAASPVGPGADLSPTLASKAREDA